MAASDTELYFELTNSVFVQSVDSPNQINPPLFYADDVKPILLKLVRRLTAQQVEVIDLTGVSVQVAIGTPAAAPTVFTSATAGSVDGDGFLPITLPFNVLAVQTALGTSLEISATMEFRVLTGSTPQRYQVKVPVRQRLITGTTQDPAPPLIATSIEEVLALCVPRDGSNSTNPCNSYILLDEDDATKQYRIVIRAGEMHVEPLQ